MASLDSELDLGQITVVTHEPANPSSPPTTTGRDPVPSAEMSGSNVTFSNVEEPRSSTNVSKYITSQSSHIRCFPCTVDIVE